MDFLTVLMITVIVFANSAGDVLITRGMKRVGEISTLHPREILIVAGKVLLNRDFHLGIFFLAIGFFSFLAVLAWADMSLVVPATSIVYVFSILGAKFVLREEVTPLRWAGTVLVCAGVALICL
ncbi:MAG: EamA family transporter [Deltaproteobacteria bacterium]|nr:EamA family transporter [Deltaproteobacteria bacterium]